MTTRVLVADDHVGFLRALVDLLGDTTEIEVVASASRGDVALELIRQRRPDLAVVDHSMPGLTGVEIAEAVAAAGLPTRVIVLTLHADRRLASRAIEAGAAGYVLKSALDEDLPRAMDTALRGGRFVTASVAGP